MLSAKQAREKTDENKVANFRKEIEKLIRHNIEKGRDEAKVSGRIPPEIVLELMENGYSVEEQKGLTKISW
jgi:hypothetical protein